MSTPLNDAARRTLAALADRIVPADEFPSASQSGAVAFIVGLLDRDLPHRWPEMLDGLSRLEGFADRPIDDQDAALAAADRAGDAFVAWLVELVLEGYYADPANGGNANAASWRMVGYDPRRPDVDRPDVEGMR